MNADTILLIEGYVLCTAAAIFLLATLLWWIIQATSLIIERILFPVSFARAGRFWLSLTLTKGKRSKLAPKRLAQLIIEETERLSKELPPEFRKEIRESFFKSDI